MVRKPSPPSLRLCLQCNKAGRSDRKQGGFWLPRPLTTLSPLGCSFSARKLKRRKAQYLKFNHKCARASLKADLCPVAFWTLNVDSSSWDYCCTSFSWKKGKALSTLKWGFHLILIFFLVIKAIVCSNKEGWELLVAVYMTGMRARREEGREPSPLRSRDLDYRRQTSPGWKGGTGFSYSFPATRHYTYHLLTTNNMF